MRSTVLTTMALLLLLGPACAPHVPGSDATERTGVARLTASGTGAVRTGHVAALLGDGRVLLAGGAVGGAPTRSAQLFDPSTGAFFATGDLGTARVNATATVLRDGRVLVVGGDDGAGGSLASAELYDPVRGTFSAAASLGAGRTRHTATRLSSGRVLVAGGSAGAAVVASVEEYTPAAGAAGAWTTLAALGAARARHTATLLGTGRLLVAGGEDAAGTPLGAELYDPAGGGSTGATAGAMTPRTRHVALLLSTGAVLLAGGLDGSGETGSSEIYDPGAGTFSAGPGPVTPRADAMAALLPDGRAVMAGGRAGGTVLDDVDVYTAAAASVASSGRLAEARAGGVATLLPSGRICMTGGGLGTAELLDRANDRWTPLSPTGYVPRHGHTTTVLVQGPDAGKVLVVGGIDPYGGYLQSAQLYDPATGTLTNLPNMGQARAFHTATVLFDGRVAVAGGQSGATSTLDTVKVYEPVGRTWSDAPTRLVAPRAHHTATALWNGFVLFAGGENEQGARNDGEVMNGSTFEVLPVNTTMQVARTRHVAVSLRDWNVILAGGEGTATVDIYNVASNNFHPSVSMATSRTRLAGAPLPDGRILFVGGTTGAAELGSAELYDPGTGAFAASPGSLTPRRDHAAVALPTGEVLVVGGQDGSGSLDVVERYEPASGRFVSAGVSPLETERALPALTLLPSGQILVWGGLNDDPLSSPSRPELYDPFFPIASTPADLAPIARQVPGATVSLALTGGSFTGGRDASSGDTRSSPVNHPVFVLERQDGQGIAFARTAAFDASTASAVLPDWMAPGWWWIRAVVAGVPGRAQPFHVLYPFQITPTEPTVPPRGSLTFTASGGTWSGYTWSITQTGSAHAETPSQPSFDPATGTYVAGATPDSIDVIRVVDDGGNVATTRILVGPGVSIIGTTAAPPRGTLSFTAQGGSGSGYVWGFGPLGNPSGGTIDPATGVYVAGGNGGVADQIQVFDSLGNHAEVSIIVTTPIAITPTTASVTPLGAASFNVSGGYASGGYTWTVSTNASGATVDASGTYQAGRTGSVADVVRVTDTLGSFAEATIDVGPAVSILPVPTTETPPRGALDFTATGGTGTFTGCGGGSCWSIVTNRSGGTIDATGHYVAGPTPDVTDVIQVSDDLGNLATLAIPIGPGVSVTPADAGAYPGDTVILTAHGGSGTGFTFTTLSITSGAGAGIVDHGDGTATYTAGTIRGATDLFRVTDSLGNTVDVNVAVWPDWRPSGSGCSALGSSGGPLALLLVVLWLARGARRRRRSPAMGARLVPCPGRGRTPRALLLALPLALAAGAARAQTPPVSSSFVVDRFQPMGGAYDLLGVQSAQVPGHLRSTFRLTVNYATRPLLVSAEDMDPVALVKSQLAGDLGVSLGVFDWAEISAVLPYMISQSREQDRFLPPDLRRELARSGLGDLRVVPKLRLLEWRKLRVGLSAPVSIPTGDEEAFLGHGAPTFGPTALVELDALGPARLLLNGGAVFRPERRLVDLTVGNAYTFGAGLEWPFHAGAQRFSALATFQGESGMKGSSAARPMELLGGLRWLSPSGVQLSLGGGPGIGKGYGTPEYRVFAEIGYTTSSTDRLAEKEPPPRPEPVQLEPRKQEEPKRAEPPPEKPKAIEPETPKAVEPEKPSPGEPEPLTEPTPQNGGTLRIDDRVLFDFNKKEIKPEYRARLKRVAERILAEPRMRVIRIEGHADDLGPPEYNLWLSEERAYAVMEYLQKCGVPARRFAVIGFGKAQPSAPGRTRDDRAKNRRVEFSVQER